MQTWNVGLQLVLILAIIFGQGAWAAKKASTAPTAVSTATAADPYELPTVVAVEGRQYKVKYDLTPVLGAYPLDAFNKSYIVGLGYTHFFKPHWGWEILNFHWARNSDSGLKRTLLDGFNVRPTGILDYVDWVAMSSFVYTPIYAKNLFFNRKLVHSDLSLVATTGVFHFQSGDRAMGFGGGFISRFFWTQRTSFKFDARLLHHLANDKNSNSVVMLMLGVSFQLGSEAQ